MVSVWKANVYANLGMMELIVPKLSLAMMIVQMIVVEKTLREAYAGWGNAFVSLVSRVLIAWKV
jgi:hypothetical protein